MMTIGEIANRLDMERSEDERRAFVVRNEAEIVGVIEEKAWAMGMRPVMRGHVVTMFRNVDYEIDVDLAAMIARMVRAAFPEEPSEEPIE